MDLHSMELNISTRLQGFVAFPRWLGINATLKSILIATSPGLVPNPHSSPHYPFEWLLAACSIPAQINSNKYCAILNTRSLSITHWLHEGHSRVAAHSSSRFDSEGSGGHTPHTLHPLPETTGISLLRCVISDMQVAVSGCTGCARSHHARS